MEINDICKTGYRDGQVLYDNNDNEYLLPEFNLDEKKNELNKDFNSFHISPCILSYFTFELIKNHVIEKGKKEHNSIKVYNFYLKKRFKFKETLNLYNKSKFQYFIHYVYNLTKKYVVKDLSKILLYNLGIFFAEKISRMIYKLIKQKKLEMKK